MNLSSVRRRWRWLAALVAVLAFAALWGVGGSSPDIATFVVPRGQFLIDVQCRGELKALKSRAVSRPRMRWARSQIVRMAPEGSTVQAGDFLIQFDTSEAAQRVEEKQNAVMNAKTELESQRATIASRMAELESKQKNQEYSYQQSKIRFEQMKYEAEIRRREQELELKKAELALQQARDKIESQKVIDDAELRKAELKVKQAELELHKATEELESQTIRAPIGGLVVYKEIWGPSGRAKVKVGDTPWPGMELIEIPDLSIMQAKIKVNEVDINRVAVGQQVIIKVDALPAESFYGEVTQVATLAKRERDSNVKNFDVDVTIAGADNRLRPGMNANCQVITDRLEDVVYVPLEAVFEKEGKTVCYVIRGGPQRRDVEVGPKNSDFVVVKEGLSQGEVVTLRDPTLPLEDLGGEPPAQTQKKKKKPQGGDDRMIIVG